MGGFTFSFLVLVSSISIVLAADTVSVIWHSDSHTYEIKNGKVDGNVAWATFSNEINQTGWSHLEVHTNSNFSNSQQSYAAGLAEGYITRDLIGMHWTNTVGTMCQKPMSKFCKKLQVYLDRNLAWVQKQIKQFGEKESFWHQVSLYLDQSSGLIDGYAGKDMKGPTHSMDATSLFMFQIMGDVEDLTDALGGSSLDQQKEKRRVRGSGHCSALIKLLPGNTDVYIAQDTWNGYESMLRVLKKYDMPLTEKTGGPTIAGKVMTFSSYPGVLMSGDDFYVISSGLVTQETTIGNSNPDLWKHVQPTGSVLEGIRNMVANRLAANGKAWTTLFSTYNSGTYNNQWMILDYNQFKPGLSVNDGLLYILEQIPGTIVSKDMTDLLKLQTYWPSYNTPFFPEIFNASGCQENVAKYGDWFSYEKTPRANIFRRDQENVTDVASFQRLMRYNNYTHDPLSACNCTPPYSAENAISARSDLNPAKGTYPFGALGHRAHGGTDMKMTTSSLAKSLDFIAVSSPTYDSVPPFQWSKSDFDKTISHIGHPDLWNFKPIKTKWG